MNSRTNSDVREEVDWIVYEAVYRAVDTGMHEANDTLHTYITARYKAANLALLFAVNDVVIVPKHFGIDKFLKDLGHQRSRAQLRKWRGGRCAVYSLGRFRVTP